MDKLIFIVILLMAFLRFYNLHNHVTYLGDQGRDAIIIKRILTFEHFPAIGAPTSIGMVYLGPFYYYFMAPWLLLFNFHPFGLAFGVAFLSVVLGILATFLIYKKFNKLTAFFFMFLLAFSKSNISLSRFSWNPNLLPIFTFFTLYSFSRLLTDKPTKNKLKNLIFPVLFGALFSFSFQLHYLAVLILPALFVVLVYQLVKTRDYKLYLSRLVLSILSFMLFSLPLLIFDLRHNFLNTNNLLKLFSQEPISGAGSFWQKLGETASGLWLNFGQFSLSGSWSLVFLFLIMLVGIKFGRKTKSVFYHLNLLNILFYIIGFSLLNADRFEHYYTPVYYSLFLVLAVVFAKRFKSCQICQVIITILLIFYFCFNFLGFKVIFKEGSKQLQHSQKVANHLSKLIGNKPYNIATWPVQMSEDNYLYFLELEGKKVMDRRKLEISKQMFVLCEKEECPVIDSPSWNISMFGKAKIAKITSVDKIKVIKLVHTK